VLYDRVASVSNSSSESELVDERRFPLTLVELKMWGQTHAVTISGARQAE
jgi:hypothetical protein